jgi:excisionase family DNA binding protein
MEPQKATLSVDQVSIILGISRNATYQGIREGEIPSIKVGRRILVPQVALLRMLGQEPKQPKTDEAA